MEITLNTRRFTQLVLVLLGQSKIPHVARLKATISKDFPAPCSSSFPDVLFGDQISESYSSVRLF